jgi:hypothetical protein
VPTKPELMGLVPLYLIKNRDIPITIRDKAAPIKTLFHDTDDPDVVKLDE